MGRNDSWVYSLWVAEEVRDKALGLLAILLIVGALVLYFLPAIIAGSRNATHADTIILINAFLGWTVIGWFGALIWACTDEIKPAPESARYPCPFCAEPILRAAKICPHCRSEIVTPATVTQPAERPVPEDVSPEAMPPVLAGNGFKKSDFMVFGIALLALLGIGTMVYYRSGPVQTTITSPPVTDEVTPATQGYRGLVIPVQISADAPIEEVELLQLRDADRWQTRVVNGGHKCDHVKGAWQVHPAGGPTVTRVDCGDDNIYLVDTSRPEIRVKRWTTNIGR